MTALQEQHVTDREGDRVGVLLGLKQSEGMPEALQELDDIRAYDEAKASEEEFVPFEQAVAEIWRKRAGNELRQDGERNRIARQAMRATNDGRSHSRDP